MDEKDLMCLSIIVQGALFKNGIGILYGCQFCQYSLSCGKTFNENGSIYFDDVRKKLQEITGTDLGYQYNPNHPEAKFGRFTKCNSVRPDG